MEVQVSLKLFATLQRFVQTQADNYSIQSDTTVGELIDKLGLPEKQVKLIFIDGVRGGIHTVLHGGERIGIFPPVGGG